MEELTERAIQARLLEAAAALLEESITSLTKSMDFVGGLQCREAFMDDPHVAAMRRLLTNATDLVYGARAMQREIRLAGPPRDPFDPITL